MNLEQYLNPIGTSPTTSLPVAPAQYATEEQFVNDCGKVTTETEPLLKEYVEELKILTRLNNCTTLEQLSELEIEGLPVGYTKVVAAVVDKLIEQNGSIEALLYKAVICFTVVTAHAQSLSDYTVRCAQQRAGRIEYEMHNPGKRKSKLILPPDAS